MSALLPTAMRAQSESSGAKPDALPNLLFLKKQEPHTNLILPKFTFTQKNCRSPRKKKTQLPFTRNLHAEQTACRTKYLGAGTGWWGEQMQFVDTFVRSFANAFEIGWSSCQRAYLKGEGGVYVLQINKKAAIVAKLTLHVGIKQKYKYWLYK